MTISTFKFDKFSIDFALKRELERDKIWLEEEKKLGLENGIRARMRQ